MYKSKVIFLFLLVINTFYSYSLDTKPPKVTIIFIVDQFAYHYIPRLENYLTGGIKFLLVNGIRYNNAYWPHARPTTATGHAGLNTGTFANYHGIISNSWLDASLKEIGCVSDSTDKAAVFSPEGLYSYGKSAKHLMVDGVSDQLMIASTQQAPVSVFSLSYKDRAAILTAGDLGKAIWFDEKAGRFTSSKAYFEMLPEWLVRFHKKYPIAFFMKKQWKPFYRKDSGAYSVAGTVSPFQRKELDVVKKLYQLWQNTNEPYEAFINVPAANEYLLQLAQECIDKHLTRGKDQRIVLWISLSPLDKLCHLCGPSSVETVDMIYHIDQQLKRFINFLRRRIKQSDVLYVLTSDHGVAPIPEFFHQKGLTYARRISKPLLVEQLEEYIQRRHGIFVKCIISPPQVYLDSIFNTISQSKQQAILDDVKTFLENLDGIKKAWTYQELLDLCVDKEHLEYLFKNQQFPGRSGHVIFQVFPYVQISRHPAGTSHQSPYEWDTHVPLMFYQKGVFEHKVINDRVWMLQFANSLAQIHKVPKPSASTFDLLPGLFPAEDALY